jgi:hypothetical protein
MRIPDDNLHSVCFLCVKVRDADGFESDYFIGTGFFVSIESRLFSGGRHFYLVTAKHVIEDTKAQGYTEFYVRINTANGESITPQIPDDWIYPENPGFESALFFVASCTSDCRLIFIDAKTLTRVVHVSRRRSDAKHSCA